jgi:hypothetical protein
LGVVSVFNAAAVELDLAAAVVVDALDVVPAALDAVLDAPDVVPEVLLDDPQPAASTSAQQAITAAGTLFIGDDPFSASSCNRTIAHRGRSW